MIMLMLILAWVVMVMVMIGMMMVMMVMDLPTSNQIIFYNSFNISYPGSPSTWWPT